MSMTIRAVYACGVLRPLQPLALEEGETVEIIVAKTTPLGQSLSNEDITGKLKAATNVAEWVAATKFLPPDDGGYDILKALNDIRISAGECPLIPDARTPS